MEHGITTVLSAPGTANVIGGQAAIFKMQERATADDLYQGVAGMKAALGQDPKGAWRNMKKMPSTRMGTAYILREALYKAKDYQQKLERAQANPEKMPERDLQSEALVKVLTGELPLYVHARRLENIMYRFSFNDPVYTWSWCHSFLLARD
jgi:imidazolonepropionase-like amidohydrolase